MSAQGERVLAVPRCTAVGYSRLVQHVSEPWRHVSTSPAQRWDSRAFGRVQRSGGAAVQTTLGGSASRLGVRAHTLTCSPCNSPGAPRWPRRLVSARPAAPTAALWRNHSARCNFIVLVTRSEWLELPSCCFRRAAPDFYTSNSLPTVEQRVLSSPPPQTLRDE